MKASTHFFIVICMLMDIIGIILFLKGFFPIKSYIEGYATYSDIIEPQVPLPDNNINIPVVNDQSRPNGSSKVHPDDQMYTRMVFMLIDALRVDFVLPHGGSTLPRMEFVEGLVKRNETVSFMAKAHPPTVTLPRIKALTTGGIPGFIDVVLNFDSESLQEDNLISQLHRQGRNIVFYGDDTWMKLFPGHFKRTDGTTSFFVTDFTEVDHNVTRHIDNELARQDWDVLILHYLGLDHIGHLAGPKSPLVKPKLQEMDDVFKKIYENMTAQDAVTGSRTLIVLCGDHGMSDQGSHGGSSASETSTPLMMTSSLLAGGKGTQFIGQSLDQTDVAPTLALVLGLPVPQNSLGTFIVDVIRGLPPRRRLQAAYNNAQQLLVIFKQNVPDFEKESPYLLLRRAVDSHLSWLEMYTSESSAGFEKECDRVLGLYSTALVEMRERVAGTLTQYDLHAMAVGSIIVWAVVLGFLLLPLNGNSAFPCTASSMLLFILCTGSLIFLQVAVCTGPYASSFLCIHQGAVSCGLVLIIVLFLSWVILQMINGANHSFYVSIKESCRHCPMLWVLLVGVVMHTLSLVASSFVEEEHQTWYFFQVTVHVMIMGLQLTTQYTNKDVKIRCNHEKSYNSSELNHEQKEPGDNIYKELSRTDGKVITSYSKEEKKRRLSTSGNKPVAVLLWSVAVLLLCRIARAWNQTGDKWAHVPDVGDWLVRPENRSFLSAISLLGMAITCLLVFVKTRSLTSMGIFSLGAAGVYLFRAANGAVSAPGLYGEIVTKGVPEARWVYTMIFIFLFQSIFKYIRHSTENPVSGFNSNQSSNQPRKLRSEDTNNTSRVSSLAVLWQDVQICWMLFVLLVLRPHNMCLASLVFWQEFCMSQVITRGVTLSVPALSLLYYWMGQAAFFYQGNSNSIATVDVSAGYIGLEEYYPAVIGLLMCLSTYAMPIYWALSGVRVLFLLEQDNRKRLCEGLVLCACTLAVSCVLPLTGYLPLVTAQRYHLFVWSVFSPKLLYLGMHTIVFTVIIALISLQSYSLAR